MSDTSMRSHARVNPYAAPRADSRESAYYTVNLSKLTFAEIWRIASPNLMGVAVFSIAKLMRQSGKSLHGTAYDEMHIVELSDVPEHARDAIESPAFECEAEGFVQRFGTTFPTVGDHELWSVALSNRERTVTAEVVYQRLAKSVSCPVGLFSLLRGGRLLMTTNMKHALEMPAEMLMEYLHGASVPQLARRHAERLEEYRLMPPVVLDEVAQRQLLLDSTHLLLEFQRARGAWVPMTTDEVAQLER